MLSVILCTSIWLVIFKFLMKITFTVVLGIYSQGFIHLRQVFFFWGTFPVWGAVIILFWFYFARMINNADHCFIYLLVIGIMYFRNVYLILLSIFNQFIYWLTIELLIESTWYPWCQTDLDSGLDSTLDYVILCNQNNLSLLHAKSTQALASFSTCPSPASSSLGTRTH